MTAEQPDFWAEPRPRRREYRPRGEQAQVSGEGLAHKAAYSTGRRTALMADLVILARALAGKAGPTGITISDVRLAADRTGVLPLAGDGSDLSFLGAVMRAAALAKTNQWRRADPKLTQSHGNNHRVHVLPEFVHSDVASKR